MIALACDHHGIALKLEIMKMLDDMGLEWKDFGAYDGNSQDDRVELDEDRQTGICGRTSDEIWNHNRYS